MEVIKFERDTHEDKIFKELRGTSFFALTVTLDEAGECVYTWYSKAMTDENIIMGAELIKKAILNRMR